MCVECSMCGVCKFVRVCVRKRGEIHNYPRGNMYMEIHKEETNNLSDKLEEQLTMFRQFTSILASTMRYSMMSIRSPMAAMCSGDNWMKVQLLFA